MAIKDILKDVLKHTHGLGIFEMVKITGDVEKATIETVDADKTVIFKGETHQPYPDFVDSTVGLSRMGVLQGYLQYPGFDGEGSTVAVKTQERNEETVPVEVEFTSADGNDAHYRFMLSDVINQQLKAIKFKGAEFDLNIVPTDKNLKDMAYFNSVLGSFEANFSPKTNGKELYFHIGDGVSDRTKILISNDIDGSITGDWRWPLDIVLKILRLGDTGNCVLSINDQGLLQIIVDSGIAKYTYLLPARS
ncbi:hypothetical protein N9C44_01090 [bacterium]|jgi:hypothetical protein|nr:hypothetical protein [bacterium]|tara:strand:+ start:9400 stop:10146 length:747 start_codon:yes stop_codon:yes gene_type:complete